MSVTTVLVPVLESEAEDLLAGHASAQLYSRAERLRREIARVDSIREELHELLFSRWAGGHAENGLIGRRAANRILRSFEPDSSRSGRAFFGAGGLSVFYTAVVRALGGRKPPAEIPTGYDPYVHLFGRPLPLFADSAKALAEELPKLLYAPESEFNATIARNLRSIEAKAASLYEQTERPGDIAPLKPAMEELVRTAQSAVASPGREDLAAAYNAIVKLSAWSWPVWRLDGESMPDLARTVGITVAPGRATALFEELKEQRPEIEESFKALPLIMPNFTSAGAYWSSGEVKSVAGSIRLFRSTLAKNAVDNADDEATTLRNLRLLEEAVLFCEAENLGLAEAAGVEWHDRPR